MFDNDWTFESRIYFMFITLVGVVLCSSQTLFGVHGSFKAICSLIGIAIVMYATRSLEKMVFCRTN